MSSKTNVLKLIVDNNELRNNSNLEAIVAQFIVVYAGRVPTIFAYFWLIKSV